MTIEPNIVGFKMKRMAFTDGRIQFGTVDVDYGGVRLVGCTLVTTRRGGVTVQPPLPATRPNPARAVEFRDAAFRAALIRKAAASYIAFGGSELNAQGEIIITSIGGRDA